MKKTIAIILMAASASSMAANVKVCDLIMGEATKPDGIDPATVIVNKKTAMVTDTGLSFVLVAYNQALISPALDEQGRGLLGDDQVFIREPDGYGIKIGNTVYFATNCSKVNQ